MKNNKGFTLIELLAVMVILGLLLSIALPGITKYIITAKKKTFLKTIDTYVTAVMEDINDMQYGSLSNEGNVYYIPVDCINIEKGGKDPFGTMKEAYVVVRFDTTNHSYDYYFTFYDDAGYGMELTKIDEMTQFSITNPTNVKAENITTQTISNERTYILKKSTCKAADAVYKVTQTHASECYSYKLTPGTEPTATITFYDKSCGKDVVIPDMIDDYLVTSIYSYAFNDMGLTSVVIPDAVTSIGSRAFAYNNLVTVKLPSNLITIDSEAFMKNIIPEIKFPSKLKTIGDRSFRYNKLTSFVIPNSVTSLGACAFCDNPIPNPSFLYGTTNGVTDYSKIRGYIGDLSEFSDKTFIIPGEVDGVPLTRIESSAFHSMGLTGWTVVIPDTVTYIGSSAFSASGIAAVNLPDGLKTIEGSAFYNNRITNIDIPDSVTKIGALAFNLNRTTDPEQMWIYKRTNSGIDYSTLIGYSGYNKSNIVIPESKNGVPLKTIADSCFRYLSLTGGVKIPNSVTSVGSLAFALNNLTYVDNGDGDKTGPFVYSRNADGSINKTSLLSYAGYQTNNVVIPSQVKRLENYAFYYTYIKAVEIPEGVTYIGNYAFQLCRLSKVVIPSTVTSIGTYAFQKQKTWTSNNGSLTKIVNKTGRAFNWQNITAGPSAATFVTGTVENWYGDIEVVASE